jgi:hypothetical protein
MGGGSPVGWPWSAAAVVGQTRNPPTPFPLQEADNIRTPMVLIAIDTEKRIINSFLKSFRSFR